MNPSIQASAAASSIHKVTNLVIASVLLMVGLYAFDQWGQVKEREEQHMRSNLMLLTRTLDTFFLSKRAGMFSLAETMAVSPGGIDNLALAQQLLADYRKHRPEVRQISLTDMNGKVAIAKRLRLALRDGDTLARIGGDEFVAVMSDLSTEHDCEPLLLRLLQVAAEPLQVGGNSLQVSASIGVTIYPQDGSSSEQLIRHADQAMYLAKQAGKNRFHLFDVASDAAIRIKRESLDQIAAAIAQHQLVLYYQPHVNMQTGDVVGMEALVRWLHPERGLLAPGQFLPVIEDHDLAIAIGERVLDLALSQMAQWLAAGLHMPVSVNVFSRQLQRDDFVHKLRQALAAHPTVPSSALELEIVETSALQDMAQVSGLMHACAELGVRFALDDFGTGYSSLTYLKKLPAELLKIDQSFVRDMLDDRDDLAIVQGVVGLSKAFNRKVIAEGVETVAHGRKLLAMGCVLGQGYGIARPMPAQQVPGWLDQWRAQQPWVPQEDVGLPA